MPKQSGGAVIMRLNERLSESPDLRPGLFLDIGAVPFEPVADYVRHRCGRGSAAAADNELHVAFMDARPHRSKF